VVRAAARCVSGTSGRLLVGAFALPIRVGTFAHTIAWARRREYLSEEARAEFDNGFLIALRRWTSQTAALRG
jgi:hypothetical protein